MNVCLRLWVYNLGLVKQSVIITFLIDTGIPDTENFILRSLSNSITDFLS